MNPTEQAARWLEGVPRWEHKDQFLYASKDGDWINYHTVLTAIARHLAPGDDLMGRLHVVSADKPPLMLVKVYASLLQDAAARISALTATVVELQAERDTAVIQRAAWELAARQMEAERDELQGEQETLIDAKDAAEAEAAALRDRLARMEGESESWKKAFAAQSNKLQKVLHIPGVRAALTETTPPQPKEPS